MPYSLSTLSREQLLALLTELESENSYAREKITQYLSALNKPAESIVAPVEKSAAVTRKSSTDEKINLFMSLFKGRTDVFAKRWQNKNGNSGYSPACKNRFVPSKCNLKIGCKKCAYREFLPLTREDVFNHLLGAKPLCQDVIGMYAIFPDSTCNFLALDFDEADFKSDVRAIRKVCGDFSIPCSVEISRSGNGSHVWFFFSEKIAAKTAREFGALIIKLAMNERHEISFASFDRMFPNQDEIPSGGFGNLIALPLQGQAVKNGRSVFVDENFSPYSDQWEYLSGVQKIALEEISHLSNAMKSKLPSKNPTLLAEKFNFAKHDFFSIQENFKTELHITLAEKIYIQKSNLTEQTLGILKRLAVFQNPEFYQKEKMRLPTYNIPRYIDCSEENKDFLILPRGCLDEIKHLSETSNCTLYIEDNRQKGAQLDLQFSAKLSEQQQSALDALLKNDTGVLSASTGFGKTVLACALISERKTNTLILVHTNALLNQWKKAIKNFLGFDAGFFGGGKDSRTGLIDIALIQSLCVNKETSPDFLKDYACVIADECHHVSAFSFERVLKSVCAKYVYGLTATPFRKDGHEKIIFMQCGQIRFKTDNKEIAESHGFDHFLIPRFVPFAPIDFLSNPEKEISITECYKFITENRERTKLICSDINDAIKNGKTPIVISGRIEHLLKIEEELKVENIAENIIVVTGKGTAKQKRETLDRLNTVPENETLILLASGKYIGEGFDNPCLDTLMLAMPVSWKGILDQYVGRLHRKSANKTEVQIFDYIDFRIPPLEKMSHKRMKEYKQLGYVPKKQNDETENTTPAIYSGSEFKTSFYENLKAATKEIYISSPYLNKYECQKIALLVSAKITSGTKVLIATKSISEKDSSTSLHANYTLRMTQHKDAIAVLQNVGCTVVEKENLSQRCAVIDSEIVWYGSANFLGFVAEDDCVMRIFDARVAAEIVGNGELRT